MQTLRPYAARLVSLSLLGTTHLRANLRAGFIAQHRTRCLSHMSRRELSILEDVTLNAAQEGRRLDAVVSELFSDRFGSATGVKRAIRRKEIRLNGAIPRTDSLVRVGDKLQVVVEVGSAPVKPHASEGKEGLHVVYEDDHFACVVKPQGIPTQGKGEGSVQGRVKYCLQPTQLPGALFRPHQVHRLDAGTGGLVLIAKTRAAVAALGTDLAAHNMQKRYLALVIGRLDGDGIVNYPLQGKTAISIYSAVQHCQSESYGWLTWVSLWPKTGRNHQLRKHMAYIGHPILGDMQYKHHRKPDCKAVPVADAQLHVPQLHDLIIEVLPEQQARMAAAAQAAAMEAAIGLLHEQGLGQQDQQQPKLKVDTQQQQQQQHHSRKVDSIECQKVLDHQQQQVDNRTAGHGQQQPPGQQQLSLQKASTTHVRPSCFSIEAIAASSCWNMSQHDREGLAPQLSGSARHVQQDAATDRGHGDCLDRAGQDTEVAQLPETVVASNYDDAATAMADDDLESSTDVADMQGDSSDSVQRRTGKPGQVLRDGSVAPMCLWAVQLQLLHPISRKPLELVINTATELYQHVCAAEAPLT